MTGTARASSRSPWYADTDDRWERRAWLRRPIVIIVAVFLVATIAASTIAIVLRSRGPERPDDPAVAAALAFAAQSTTTDRAVRDRAIGRWVIPHRVTEFVEAFDATYEERAAADGSVSAVPRAYRVVEESPTLAVVLVWSDVTTATGETAEISGYGVTSQFRRWWVFSYEGTAHDVLAGDPRLDDFTELPP